MAMVLLGVPVTAFAWADVPVAQSVYIKATNVPGLEVGKELPSLDDVQLEVTVFAPGAGSTSVEVLYLVPAWTPGDTATEDNFQPSFLAVFDTSGSFTVDESTTFASNLGAALAGISSGVFAVMLPLDGAFPVVSVAVVDVPDLVVGQHFPELDLARNFTVSVLSPGGTVPPSAGVTSAFWCTASDWQPVADGAVVQPGVSYGIGTAVVGDGDLFGGPSATAGVVGSLPVGAVFASADATSKLGVALLVPMVAPDDPNVPAGAVQLKPSDLRAGSPTHWTFHDRDITSWREVDGVYQTQNQSTAFDSNSHYFGILPNMTPCVLTVPVEVPSGGGTLSFDWMVSSEGDWDCLWYEVLDSFGEVVNWAKKSGEESAFDTVTLDCGEGSYTLKFTYQGDISSCWDGADTGYVRNISFTPADSSTPTSLSPTNLDSTPGSVLYMSQNQSTAFATEAGGVLPNATPCVLTVPVEVPSGGGTLSFDWKVSSEEEGDFLWCEVLDSSGEVVDWAKKSGEESAFDTVTLDCGEGSYTLKFTYQGNTDGWWAGDDTGYVKNLLLWPSLGVPVTGVALSESMKSLEVGDTFDLVATVSPDEATNKDVTWGSSDTSVATVDENGTVKALKTGKTTITVTTKDGNKTATCVVTVTQPVTSVSLSETTKTLTVGDSFTLTAEVSPEDASNKTVTWSSSDATVASVDENGTVTALRAGKTTITVTTNDSGHEATCEVTVTEAAGSEPDSPTPPPGPDSPDTPDTPDNPDAPPVDRSSWGTPYVREADGVTQYVVEDPTSPDYGMTSVELDPELASADSAASLTYWLRESSGLTSAWYGLTAHISTCHPGYRFYVQWLSPGDPGYDALLAQLDDAAKQRIEDDNGWIFNMGIRDPDGKDLHYITPPSDFSLSPIVYVQIGDDWDLEHLKAYYIASGGDETVPVEYVTNFGYPDGTDEFGMMTLSHFSPYIIFDELTDEEKAALTPKPNDNSNSNNQTTDKPNSSGTDLPGTGDISTELLISGLALVLVSSLGVMLRLITNKKKFEE